MADLMWFFALLATAAVLAASSYFVLGAAGVGGFVYLVGLV